MNEPNLTCSHNPRRGHECRVKPVLVIRFLATPHGPYPYCAEHAREILSKVVEHPDLKPASVEPLDV